MLLTWHNLTFYQDLMAGLRAAIAAETLAAFAAEFAGRYGADDDLERASSWNKETESK
jgi:queuine tRNA-ribosyltransferase